MYQSIKGTTSAVDSAILDRAKASIGVYVLDRVRWIAVQDSIDHKTRTC